MGAWVEQGRKKQKQKSSKKGLSQPCLWWKERTLPENPGPFTSSNKPFPDFHGETKPL